MHFCFNGYRQSLILKKSLKSECFYARIRIQNSDVIPKSIIVRHAIKIFDNDHKINNNFLVSRTAAGSWLKVRSRILCTAVLSLVNLV